ncbi:MAG: putative metal-binding motif-containing protein [Pseudomonadota bacterium]
MLRFASLLSLTLLGCHGHGVKVDDTGGTDEDGDGVTAEAGDCDDGDGEVYPGATDWVGDDVDQNCDGIDGVDADSDGYASTMSGGDDCDDEDPYIHPGVLDVWYDGVDQDCDGANDYDQDGDGYDLDQDCDDEDAEIRPGADEHCDDVDEDCDGEIDENPVDPTLWSGDGDGDGWGGEGATVQGCDAPSGYGEYGDCDDTNASIHPEADEWCNQADDDCDGEIDEDAVDAETWYADDDSDGYGDERGSTRSCDPIPDRITTGGDCDDDDPSIHPDADEYCNGVDDDCEGDIDEDDAVDVVTWYQDADSDGWGDDAVHEVDCDPVPHHVDAGGDCDDTDPDFHPEAYDRPDDGLDQDCDGADRAFDGVVLDFGDTVTQDTDAALVDVSEGYDLVVLMDTTGSMGTAIYSLDFPTIDAAVSVALGTVQYGYATFDDYNYSSYGSSYDVPFALLQQVTDDLAAVDAAEAATPTHYGGDYPESSMEALHQALTGQGYDQDCDGTVDTYDDVLPFLASASDPFGGTGGQSYDATTSGGGTLGGMGFRSGAVPIVAYVTDYDMRDPDEGYSTPGGCPLDAGSADVVADTLDMGAWLVGVHYNTTTSTPYGQMLDLAERTGSLADLDGDGTVEELAFANTTTSTINSRIAQAVNAIDAEVVASLAFDEVWLEVADDPYGMVVDINPGSYTAVTSSDWPLAFTITWSGTLASTTSAQSVIVTFDIYGDGDVIGSLEVEVEVPPS